MNLLRQIEVLVGPLSEKQGGGDATQAARYFSDGSMAGVRVTAQIQKSKISIPNASRISLYNISPGMRAQLKTPGLQVVINAGYQNQQMHQIFKGGLLNSYSERQGADIVTHILAMTGWFAMTGKIVNFTIRGGDSGTTLHSTVLALASTLEGVVVEESRVKVGYATFPSGGWSFKGTPKDGLDSLAKQYGFSWSIEDNVFQALGDKQNFDDNTFLDGDGGYLINVTPILTGPFQMHTGTKIKAFLLPLSSPGSTVAVNSTINPEYNDIYVIHTVDYKLDTFGPEWSMDIQSLKTWA